MANYYKAKDIQELCHVSRTTAYQLIARLNKELEDQGYIVPKPGQCPCDYANMRLRLNCE